MASFVDVLGEPASSYSRRMREPPPRAHAEGDSKHIDTGFQGVEETLMLMRDSRWKYKPRTQSHTDGGSKRSSLEVITASRTQLTERTSETVETGLYGDSLSFHARITFQHQRQLQEEGEMQNSAIAFGDSYRAKASAKKLAKTVEFPLNHEKEDLDREREREEEAEAAARTKIQTIQKLQQNSQWTIAGTKREVQLLPDRKAHTATVQAAARLLELQKISNGGSPSLTPQSSRLVVKKPTPSGTPHQPSSEAVEIAEDSGDEDSVRTTWPRRNILQDTIKGRGPSRLPDSIGVQLLAPSPELLEPRISLPILSHESRSPPQLQHDEGGAALKSTAKGAKAILPSSPPLHQPSLASSPPLHQPSRFNDRERNSTGGLRGRLAPLVKLRALAAAEEESRKQVAIKNFTFNQV